MSTATLEYGRIRIWVSKYAEVLYCGTFTQKLHAKQLQEELRTNNGTILIPDHLGIYDPVQVHDRMK